MSKGKCHTKQFKEETVKQIVERGYSAAEVPERLGVCTRNLIRLEGLHARQPAADQIFRRLG